MVPLPTLAVLYGLAISAVSARPSQHLKRQNDSTTTTTTARFFPTINMTSTDGSPIQAHGGAILQGPDSAFYWFGEDKTGETTSGHFIGVNCYRSLDFSSWDAVGAVLTPQAGTNISGDSVVERPKVLYNEGNDEFVMWFHSDTADYGAAAVGVAMSKSVDGVYEWKGSFKPFGNDSRDMTVWKDDDGTAYLIFATADNADLQIASLTDDYYNVSEALYTWSNVYWEAPGIFKVDDTYHLLYSRQDGWTPTDNYYMTATSMSGPWSDPVLLAPEGSYAYNTQNAYDITIQGSKETLRIYYGDHWNAPNLGASTYSFYPVISNSSGLFLHYTGGWTANITTGEWSDLDFTTITATDADVTITPSTALIDCANCTSGKTANMTSDSTFSFTWDGTAGDKVLSMQYVYDGGKNAWKNIAVAIDNATLDGVALLESTRGTGYYLEAPIRATLEQGSVVEFTLTEYTGTDVFIQGVKVYDA